MIVTDHLTTLEASGLIRLAQMEPELEYLFRHALVQDAAYESLLKADRRVLHQSVAETLEQLYPEQKAELASTLGYHYSAAGETEQAHKYFTLAGDSALAQYANAEAEQHYRAALSFAVSSADKAHALSQLGETFFAQSRFEEAIRTWREAIGLYQVLKDDDPIARLYARTARAAWSAGDTPRGLALAREGLALVHHSPATLGKAMLLHDAGRAYMFNFKTSESLSFCQQALAIAEQLGNVEVQADILATLGLALEATRQLDQAIQTLETSAQLADITHSLKVAARAHENLGGKRVYLQGNLRAGYDHLFRAAELNQRMGNVASELQARCLAAFPAFFLGDFAAVQIMLSTLRYLLHTLSDPTLYQLWLRTIEALLLRYQGELTGCIPILRDCYAQARQASRSDWLYEGTPLFAEALLESNEIQEAGQVSADWIKLCGQAQWASVVTVRCVLSAMHLREGRIEEARRLLAEIHEKFGSQITAFEAEHLALAEARLAVAEKRWPEALAAFEATVNAQTRMGKRWYHAQTLREWAEAHLARNEPGDIDRARELLQEAQSEFEAMNVPKYAMLVKERLQSL